MWTPLASNDLSRFALALAGASLTYGGSIAFALGNQLHLLSRTYTTPLSPEVDGLRSSSHELNSVLPDYHPQLLVLCLLSREHVYHRTMPVFCS